MNAIKDRTEALNKSYRHRLQSDPTTGKLTFLPHDYREELTKISEKITDEIYNIF